jgi:hypothetical protein
MFVDLWRKHRDWVVEPFSYRSVAELTDLFDKVVVEPALRRESLEVKKARELIIRAQRTYDESLQVERTPVPGPRPRRPQAASTACHGLRPVCMSIR